MADLAKKADESGATKEQLAAVLSDDPETNEEAFEAAFDEFAAEDDSETAALTAPDGAVEGREDDDKADEGREDDDKAEAKPASGEESPDTDEAARKSAADEQDIWADATPAQRAAYQAAQQENRSHRGRASAAARAVAPTKPAAVDKAADKPATRETDENWEQFKTDYPEVAGPMEQRFENRMAKLEGENADLRGQVTGITDSRLADATDAEEDLLAQRHPDWEQLTASDDFSAWLSDQPRYVQEGFARNGNAIIDGQEAASLIDLFVKGSDAKQPEPEPEPLDPKNTPNSGKATRRTRRLESAVTTESGQAGPGAGPPEGDFDAAFDHFARQP